MHVFNNQSCDFLPQIRPTQADERQRRATFQPDDRHVFQVVQNERPQVLSLSEHPIQPAFISEVLGTDFGLAPERPPHYRNFVEGAGD